MIFWVVLKLEISYRIILKRKPTLCFIARPTFSRNSKGIFIANLAYQQII